MQTLINTLGWVFVLYIIPAIGSFFLIRAYNKEVYEEAKRWAQKKHCTIPDYFLYHKDERVSSMWFIIPFWNMMVFVIAGIASLYNTITRKVGSS